MKQKISLKLGDNVKVITGVNKNKTGKILKLNKKSGKILIEGINFKFKHVKPKTKNDIGEIKKMEAPIHHSNVKLIEIDK